MNPDCKTFEAAYPSAGDAEKFGVKAVGRSVEGGWQLEIKIPTGKMHALKAGETWRVLLCRNRMRRTVKIPDNYTSDMCPYHDTVQYHSMVIE